MPRTAPWNAAEHHNRGYLWRDAVEMDVYSLGLLCLWLLFGPDVRVQVSADDSEWESNAILSTNARMQNWLEHQVRETDLVTCSMSMVQAVSGLSDEQKAKLLKFISMTLPLNPSDRASDVERLLPLLSIHD